MGSQRAAPCWFPVGSTYDFPMPQGKWLNSGLLDVKQFPFFICNIYKKRGELASLTSLGGVRESTYKGASRSRSGRGSVWLEYVQDSF